MAVMTLTNTYASLITRVMNMATWAHDHETDLADANVQSNAAGGFIDLFNAMTSQEQQDFLDAIPGLGGMNPTEFKDLFFIVTSDLQVPVSAKRTQLAAIIKYQTNAGAGIR